MATATAAESKAEKAEDTERKYRYADILVLISVALLASYVIVCTLNPRPCRGGWCTPPEVFLSYTPNRFR